MIKKLLSIILLMVIIFSSCVYGVNVIVPEENNKPSEEQTIPKPDSSEPSTKPENKEDEVVTDKENNKEDANKDTTSKNPTTNKENNKDQEKNEDKKQTTTGKIEKKKSSEARLKNLKVDVEGLTPEFDKDTTEYYLTVDLSVNKIKVTSQVLDNKATYAVYGNKNLKEGKNTITVQVTAEDGTKEKYYIYVTKVDDVELANAELESLKIEGFNLYPSFKSNIYSYNLNIDEDIKELDITATPQREKATVEIEGNTNLHEGENIIKINVTAEDETTQRTYKIKTFINSDTVKIEEEDKLPAIIMLAVLGLGVIISGIMVIVKNKK